jgi:hypothetical protein
MSNVVGFLEALSLDARALSEADYRQAVEQTGFDAVTRQALLTRDPATLNAVLGARATVMAFVFPAEDEPDTEQPDTDDPDREPKEGDHESHNATLAA